MREWILDVVWVRLRLPAAFIVAHFVVSALAMGSIFISGKLAHYLGLSEKAIPYFGITIEDLILAFEIFNLVGIIILGILEAIAILFLTLVLDCIRLVRGR